MAKLGKIDINTDMSMLASKLALPKECHLKAVFHIYAFLRQKYNSRSTFDQTYPIIDKGDFKEYD